MPEPTIEQMKQALRVAEEAIKEIRGKACEADNYLDVDLNPNEIFGLSDKALTQISPILENLEEGK